MTELENAKLKGILLDAPNLECECGCTIFTPGFVYKKISALVNPMGVDQKVPIDVMICTKCGKVVNTFSDKETYDKVLGVKKSVLNL